MAHGTRSGSTGDTRGAAEEGRSITEQRERTVASMLSAGLLAALGTLIFWWALRSPEYQWLFAVGAIPWVVGTCIFARAVWRYTHL